MARMGHVASQPSRPHLNPKHCSFKVQTRLRTRLVWHRNGPDLIHWRRQGASQPQPATPKRHSTTACMWLRHGKTPASCCPSAPRRRLRTHAAAPHGLRPSATSPLTTAASACSTTAKNAPCLVSTWCFAAPACCRLWRLTAPVLTACPPARTRGVGPRQLQPQVCWAAPQCLLLHFYRVEQAAVVHAWSFPCPALTQ